MVKVASTCLLVMFGLVGHCGRVGLDGRDVGCHGGHSDHGSDCDYVFL